MEAKRQIPSEIEASSLVITHCDSQEGSETGLLDGCTNDGSVDRHGRPATKDGTGGWRSGMLVLISEGFAAVAFTGVEVNLVLFSKTVLNQSNASSAGMFSRWMAALNIFALLGAFLSDSYLGRYLTCAVFQAVIILGLLILSLSTHAFLVKPKGCGTINGEVCDPNSNYAMAIFYISIYLIALGSGTMEPALGTFGADQFDEEDAEEKKSKSTFLSYYYVALNLGSLIAEIVVVYIANLGRWDLAFWASTLCSLLALVFLSLGFCRYRHFKPSGNTLARFSQVIVASARKMKLKLPPQAEFYEFPTKNEQNYRKILHTNDFKFLDRAALMTSQDMDLPLGEKETPNPWHICTVTQVEEVKCVLRLIPIWFCTIIASIVFVQVFSLFVEQGASMNTKIFSGYSVPPASMPAVEIISSSLFVICTENVILPLYVKLTKRTPKPPSELKRIGVGLVLSIIVMIIAGLLEQHRLRHAVGGVKEASKLSILWQIPQYVLVGVAEAFVIVGQWEFFVSQIPDGLKSMGLGLSISASAIGGYLNSAILTAVMRITTKNGKPGWMPSNLNDGHLDRFFFLVAALIAADLVSFIIVSRRYKSIILEERNGLTEEVNVA